MVQISSSKLAKALFNEVWSFGPYEVCFSGTGDQALLVWIVALQLLQEHVTAGERVVSFRNHEELEDGSPGGTQEENRAVPVRPRLHVHHHLVQLVPTGRGRSRRDSLFFF